jgi:hypothetical protein
LDLFSDAYGAEIGVDDLLAFWHCLSALAQHGSFTAD